MAGHLQNAAVFVVLALVSPAGAQDGGLPPGVLLLSRIKRHVKQELQHLPEFTCLETVARSMWLAAGRRLASNQQLAPLDTLRLEILYSENRELYASPGASSFRQEHPAEFVVGGMIGDGIFATHLHSIFVSETALFTWRGEDMVSRDRGWARAVKYDYRIPRSQSGWNITVEGGRGVVGSIGSVWVDPETLDVLRVEMHASEIPVGLPISEITLTSNYARMRIGEADIMLPQTAELRMLHTNGDEFLNEFDFTHCRSYHAQSTISFETPDNPAAKATAPAPALSIEPTTTLPAGLTVPIELTTAVKSDATVGTLLEGRVSTDVSVNGKKLIPAGSRVHGRIRRLEHSNDAGGYFTTGLEFTEVDAAGTLLRFYADLQTASGAPGLEWMVPGTSAVASGSGLQVVTHVTRSQDLPGVGTFYIRGSKFALPAGFKMIWKTRAFGK